MREIFLGFFLSFCFFSMSAQAQVYRCTGSDGKLNYSDVPCSSQEEGQLIQRGLTPQERALRDANAALAAERRERSRLAAELRESQAQQRQVQQQAEMQSRQLQAQAQRTPTYQETIDCKNAKRKLDFVRNERIPDASERRHKINVAISNVNSECGTSTELIQEPVNIHVHQNNRAPQPSVITDCRGGFCYDNLGGVYHQTGGSHMTRNDGKVCTDVGGFLNCH